MVEGGTNHDTMEGCEPNRDGGPEPIRWVVTNPTRSELEEEMMIRTDPKEEDPYPEMQR